MKRENRKIVRTTTWSAGPGCHGGCGVLAHIEDGKLVKIEGDPDHPWNQGRLCARCLAMTQYVNHPDRLTSPLKRVGERGEGKWQEISWDEAFDLIEERLGTIREQLVRRVSSSPWEPAGTSAPGYACSPMHTAAPM